MASVALTPRTAQVYFNSLPEPVQIDQVATGSTAPLSGIALPKGAAKALQFQIDVKYYSGGSLVVDVLWYARNGTTTGNVQWTAQIAAVSTDDTTSMEAKNFAATSTTTTTVNANTKGLKLTTVTIANLDSTAAGDYVLLRIGRGTDTMVDDAIFVHGSCYFSSSDGGAAPFTVDTTYYINASTGNDSNDGLTAGTAWQTATRAWAERTKYGDVLASMVFQFLGANSYTLPQLGASRCGTGGSITFRGDTSAETTNATGTFTGAINSSTAIVGTSAGLGADTQRGRFLRITSGTLTGAILLILQNTDTTIQLPNIDIVSAGNTVNGDTFTIFTPGTTFSFNTAGSGQPTPAPTDWVGGGVYNTLFPSNYPAHTFFDCLMAGTATFINSSIGLIAVRTAGTMRLVSSQVVCGGATNGFRWGVGTNSATALITSAGLSTPTAGGSGYSVFGGSTLSGVMFCGSSVPVNVGSGLEPNDAMRVGGSRFVREVSANGSGIQFTGGFSRLERSISANHSGRVTFAAASTVVFATTGPNSCIVASYGGNVYIESTAISGGTTSAAFPGCNASDGGRILWKFQTPTLTGGTAGNDLLVNSTFYSNATLGGTPSAVTGVTGDIIARVF